MSVEFPLKTSQNRNMPRKPLSSFEYTVLGIVWREGPCTTYFVMTTTAQSPSGFFRKRSSSTYAVAQKLLTRGLIRPIDGEIGPRGERLLEATPEGIKLLREWIEKIPHVEAAYSNDLVRLRVNFLNALSPQEQREFVGSAREQLETVLVEQEEALAGLTDRFRRQTYSGLIHETKARLVWLSELQTEVDRPEIDSPSERQ